jgi:uncharacterized Zn finger protein
MRPPETIPPDEITGHDLMPWHVVTIECGGCGHGRVVDHRLVQRRGRGFKPLSRLNWKCGRCGRTSADVQHVIRVVKLPRNY